MISGTICLEDLVLHFRALDDTQVDVSVFEHGPVPQSRHAVMDGRDFMVVLGLALNFDGEVPEEAAAWDAAERVTAALDGLRICP